MSRRRGKENVTVWPLEQANRSCVVGVSEFFTSLGEQKAGTWLGTKILLKSKSRVEIESWMLSTYGAMQYYMSPAISPLPRAVRRRNDLGSEGVYSGLVIWASDLEERE